MEHFLLRFLANISIDQNLGNVATSFQHLKFHSTQYFLLVISFSGLMLSSVVPDSPRRLVKKSSFSGKKPIP